MLRREDFLMIQSRVKAGVSSMRARFYQGLDLLHHSQPAEAGQKPSPAASK